MKFGAALPYGSARTAANLAQLAEPSGWDGIFLGDAIWCQDPMICLSAAAMTTRRIRLGTMVVPVPLRRPWKLASKSVALDHLSNGRLTLAWVLAQSGWAGTPSLMKLQIPKSGPRCSMRPSTSSTCSTSASRSIMPANITTSSLACWMRCTILQSPCSNRASPCGCRASGRA